MARIWAIYMMILTLYAALRCNRQVHDNKVLRGRKNDLVYAACLLVASRQVGQLVTAAAVDVDPAVAAADACVNADCRMNESSCQHCHSCSEGCFFHSPQLLPWPLHSSMLPTGAAPTTLPSPPPISSFAPLPPQVNNPLQFKELGALFRDNMPAGTSMTTICKQLYACYKGINELQQSQALETAAQRAAHAGAGASVATGPGAGRGAGAGGVAGASANAESVMVSWGSVGAAGVGWVVFGAGGVVRACGERCYELREGGGRRGWVGGGVGAGGVAGAVAMRRVSW